MADMKIGSYTIPQIRKAVVAIIGALIVVILAVVEVSSDALSADATAWITSVVAILTAISVFLVKNATIIDAVSEGKIPPLPPTGPVV